MSLYNQLPITDNEVLQATQLYESLPGNSPTITEAVHDLILAYNYRQIIRIKKLNIAAKVKNLNEQQLSNLAVELGLSPNQDNILDIEFANKLRIEILNIPDEDWDRYNNPFEQKYTFRDKYNLPNNCSKLFKYLTSESFVKHLSEVVEIKLINDPNRNFWGIHKYENGDYLDIHVDAGLHPITKQNKQVTLGIYLSTDNWTEENKGSLEIWEGDNCKNDDAKIHTCANKLLPIFNRLIVFVCNDYSWHGNPTKIKCADEENRILVTLSYLSETYYENNKVKAFLVTRQEDEYDEKKDKLRMLRCDPVRYKEIYSVNK